MTRRLYTKTRVSDPASHPPFDSYGDQRVWYNRKRLHSTLGYVPLSAGNSSMITQRVRRRQVILLPDPLTTPGPHN